MSFSHCPPISLSRPAAGCPRWILSHTNSGRPVLTLRDATSILSLLVRMDRSCKAPPSGRQGRAFLHLARFLLLYLFLLLPAPRFPVDNLLPPLLRFSGCPMLLAQCPSPYLPTSPLLVSRVLSFSSFLSFHFSTCCFLICLTSHASRPPFSLFLSAVLCIPVPRTIENCASSMKDSTAYS